MKDFVLFSSEESSVQPVQQASPPDELLVKLLKDIRTKHPNHGGSNPLPPLSPLCQITLCWLALLQFNFIVQFRPFFPFSLLGK